MPETPLCSFGAHPPYTNACEADTVRDDLCAVHADQIDYLESLAAQEPDDAEEPLEEIDVREAEYRAMQQAAEEDAELEEDERAIDAYQDALAYAEPPRSWEP